MLDYEVLAVGRNNRTRPLLQRIRDIQNPWAIEYVEQLTNWLALEADPERSRLSDELESSDLGTFHSAALELFLTGYFRRRGWLAERHPLIAQSAKAPDFGVRHDGGDFYAEAVVGQDPPKKSAQRQVMLALRDELDEVEGPFDVSITPTGPWDGRFSRSRVRTFLEQQLRLLEGKPDIRTATVDYTLDPHLPLQFDIFRGDTVGPVVAAWWTGDNMPATVTTHETLYDRVRRKASRYGKLDRPYVVFVRLETDFPVFWFAIERALYGSITANFRRVEDGGTEFVGRTQGRDGVFSGHDRAGRPIHTRLSAVGIYHHFTDWVAINRHELAIYHNPWAALPLEPGVFSDLPQLISTRTASAFVRREWVGEPPEWAVEERRLQG